MELFDEIAAIYKDLTDKDQAALLEVLAGKRQGQIVGSILNNYKTRQLFSLKVKISGF